MARIRTIKPEFFRHEALFEAERATDLPLRLAYAGLWTAADREGRFKWKPRELKLDCLPYDDVDFAAVLDALHQCGAVVKYTFEGAEYGHIPSWHKHQHINQREAQSTLPDPASASTCMHIPAHGEGKGREGNGNIGGGGTREPLVSREAIECAELVATIAGLPDPKGWPPNWCGAPMRAQELIANGWTRGDFEAGARATMTGKTDPPASFRYFEPAIARAYATRTAPIPVGKPERSNAKVGNVLGAADELIDLVRQFDEPAPREGAVRIGTSSAAIRAIPQG
jgi:hypothetical protein